jgi:radical SAM protein with 4Fe4S-binding SPASM domain
VVPKTIIWLITGRCNFDCRYCYAKRMRACKELPTEKVFKIIDEASILGVEHIAFTGGEPLLREDILPLLRYTRERGIQVSITTNGSLITEDIAKEFLEFGVFIYLSLNGVGDEHERLRGEGSWGRLLITIEILNKIGLGFATITTLHKGNYKDIGEIIKFCSSSGPLFSCFLPLMPFDNVAKESLLGPIEILETLKAIDKEARDIRYRVSLWCMPFAKRFIQNRWIRIGGCRDREVIDIGVNGDLLLCDVLDISLATLRIESLRDAANRFEAHKLNKEISFPTLRGECIECKAKSVCLGGCYARAYKEYGTFNEKDPLCPVGR